MILLRRSLDGLRWLRASSGLAARNVFRHRARTTLTLLVIAAGVAGLIVSGGFIDDALLQLRESTIHSQLGHIQVSRVGYHANGSTRPYQYIIESPSGVVETIGRAQQVSDVMSRLAFAGVVNNGRADFAIVGEGVEPSKEARLGNSIQFVAGRSLEDVDRFGIVLGEGVASATKLGVGDKATLLLNTADGALNSIEFDVVGIFRSFSKDFDARAVRITLGGAQELLGTRGANVVVVSLTDTRWTDPVASSLRGTLDASRFEVKTWDELADFYTKAASLYQRQFTVLQAVILLAVLLSVINSVNMSIFERTGEFGTLMALGTPGSDVVRLVILENVVLGLMGSLLGGLLGCIAAWVISAIGLPMPPPPNSSVGYNAAIHLSVAAIAGAWLVGLSATVLASILPARRVSRIPVAEALRHN